MMVRPNAVPTSPASTDVLDDTVSAVHLHRLAFACPSDDKVSGPAGAAAGLHDSLSADGEIRYDVHGPLANTRLFERVILYAKSCRRLSRRRREKGRESRIVFVVGSPRAGTTFLAGVVGTLPGFVDLGELGPVKAAVPSLATMPDEEAAYRLRKIVERVRWIARLRDHRVVEQTPELAFLVRQALQAYPQARVLHIIRDGRDVAASLLERGWLRASRDGHDDVGQRYGAHARFWVEPCRVAEFSGASDATRAAWAWRRYVTAARVDDPRVLELRYEAVVRDIEHVSREIAAHLGVEPALLLEALAAGYSSSIGRWQRELAAEQLADVEREAGELLRDLGYLGADRGTPARSGSASLRDFSESCPSLEVDANASSPS